jgi:hypothetical protein
MIVKLKIADDDHDASDSRQRRARRSARRDLAYMEARRRVRRGGA